MSKIDNEQVKEAAKTINHVIKEAVQAAKKPLLARIAELKRQVTSHEKGESCKYFCRKCTKPIWLVDQENVACPFCGWSGFPVPDIDAEIICSIHDEQEAQNE